MPKLEDVIKQVQSELPKYDNSFNDINNIDDIVNNSGEITIDLVDENYQDSIVNIDNVYAKLDVIGVTAGSVANTYDIQTEIDHDQTLSEQEKLFGQTKYVQLLGVINDEVELVDVPYNDIVTIKSTVPPTGGSLSLLEDRGYSGRKNVTWDDSQTLRYDVEYSIEPYSLNGTVQSNIRVDGISDEGQLVDYLENNAVSMSKNSMYIILRECNASKSRFTYSDAFNRKEYKDDLQVEIVQPFSLFAIIPTQDKITPREAINYIYKLRTYLVKSLHGALFDSGFLSEDKFLCTYQGDDGEAYNKSYYVHRFDFETVFNIENEDSIEIENTRAFREFDIGFKLSYDEYDVEKKNISGEIE